MKNAIEKLMESMPSDIQADDVINCLAESMARLKKGEHEYGSGAYLKRTVAENLDEISEEYLDIINYAMTGWIRIQRVKEMTGVKLREV